MMYLYLFVTTRESLGYCPMMKEEQWEEVMGIGTLPKLVTFGGSHIGLPTYLLTFAFS